MNFIKTTLIFLVFLCMSCGTEPKQARQLETPSGKTSAETTYFLIRHAEKRRDKPKEKNPELNDKGFERSKYWGEYFEDKGLEMFYTTDVMRTFQTMIPIVYPYKDEVVFYEPKDSLFTDEFWTKTYGKTAIIVGHSNTTPEFVNQIIGDNKYESIPDSINHRLYKVKVDKEGFIALDTFVDVIL